jgi:hypothetical protein
VEPLPYGLKTESVFAHPVCRHGKPTQGEVIAQLIEALSAKIQHLLCLLRGAALTQAANITV